LGIDTQRNINYFGFYIYINWTSFLILFNQLLTTKIEILSNNPKISNVTIENYLKYQNLMDMVFIVENRQRIAVLIASFIILVMFYIFPTPVGLDYKGKMMLGVLVLGILLWASEAIPLAITGLLVMILQPILYITEPKEVFTSFGNTAIFFLIGAFIIASAVEKHNLHKRVAILFLRRFENNPKMFTLGIMLCCAFLSFIIPEHAVAVLMMPIVLSILVSLQIVPHYSNFGKVSMLAIAYGCSIGSLGTLIGGARNPVTIGFLETQNIKVTFLDWMIYSVPVVIISLPFIWFILISLFPIEVKDLSEVRKKLHEDLLELGPFSAEEKVVTSILAGTVLAWIIIPNYFSYIGLAVIAVAGGIVMFFSGSISWKDIEQRVPWGIVLLYGGAISLGVGMVGTGAAEWLANNILSYSGDNYILVILILIVLTMVFTNVMSNTAAVAMILPIGAGVALALDFATPLVTSMLIGLSGGLAFMLVIATPANAITYSAGYYSTRDLFRAGLIANLICLVVLFLIAVFYWRLIGLW
jgi:sodium-dependent dicarboxylate transporter 2/3/5